MQFDYVDEKWVKRIKELGYSLRDIKFLVELESNILKSRSFYILLFFVFRAQ